MESRLTPAAAEQVHEHRHQRTGAGHNRPDLVLDEGHVLHHIAHTPPCLRPDHLDFTGPVKSVAAADFTAADFTAAANFTGPVKSRWSGLTPLLLVHIAQIVSMRIRYNSTDILLRSMTIEQPYEIACKISTLTEHGALPKNLIHPGTPARLNQSLEFWNNNNNNRSRRLSICTDD
jgi:hypothetical protein